MTLAYSLLTECGVEGTGSWDSDHSNCRSSVRRRCSWLLRPTLSSVLDARGEATWLGNALPQHWL